MSVIKKIALTSFALCVLHGSAAQAYFLVPYFDITIITNVAGGDDKFTYRVQGTNGALQDMDVWTTQGAGSSFFETYINNTATAQFTVREIFSPNWQRTSVACATASAQVSYAITGTGLNISAVPYSSITCTFNYQQNSGRVPVLLVPGVLGTNLSKNNLTLWTNIEKMALDVGDDFMDPLQFSSQLYPSDDSLVIDDVVRNPSNLFNYTSGLIQELINQGYIENQDLFVFPYDWRYGVSGKDANGQYVNVEALKQKIQMILSQTLTDRVDVVAHSTGGLLVKKYVIDNPVHHIGKAIFVGVPNLGAPKAAKVLVQGDGFGVPWLADGEMKKIGQNLPVVYDLAPSRTYVDKKGSFYRTIDQKFLAKDVVSDLNYDDAWSLLVHSRGANQTALTNAEALHSQSFDDFDLRTRGVDLYNIVGCKRGTIGKVVERRVPALFGGPVVSYDRPVETPGDGTVPLESATNVPVDAAHRFYGLKAEHGQMLSGDGTRQQIVNILADSNLPTPGVTNDVAQCKLNGRAISIYSPLDVVVTDQYGNELKKASDGSVQNRIANSDFQLFGEHKFVYVPQDEGQEYTFHFQGTGDGTFTLIDQSIVDNAQGSMSTFVRVPVTPDLSATFAGNGPGEALKLDTDSDGVIDQVVSPTAVLPAIQASDTISPVTVSALSGDLGLDSFYRSGVTVAFAASDHAPDSSVSSGVFETLYSVDGGAWQVYSAQFGVTSEGVHSVRFYSIDKAGNEEPVQTTTFTIDTTAPEIGVSFDVAGKDLAFSGTDNLDPAPLVQDLGDKVQVTDRAGNSTVLGLNEKDRKNKLKAALVSLSYNGVKQDMTNNKLTFFWNVSRQGVLQRLDQQAKSKKDFTIAASFDGQKTKVTGRDATGQISQLYSALKLLQISTQKGDLVWSVQ